MIAAMLRQESQCNKDDFALTKPWHFSLHSFSRIFEKGRRTIHIPAVEQRRGHKVLSFLCAFGMARSQTWTDSKWRFTANQSAKLESLLMTRRS